MLTTLYERFEQVNSDFADAHKKFHNEFEKMEEAMEKGQGGSESGGNCFECCEWEL